MRSVGSLLDHSSNRDIPTILPAPDDGDRISIEPPEPGPSFYGLLHGIASIEKTLAIRESVDETPDFEAGNNTCIKPYGQDRRY